MGGQDVVRLDKTLERIQSVTFHGVFSIECLAYGYIILSFNNYRLSRNEVLLTKS